MHLVIRPGDVVPIYRQLMRQIEDAIATGRLLPGAQLPSHRELSEQLVIAPLTVKKAYDELEARGYLETQRGRGTFVRNTRARGARDAAAQVSARAAQADAVREAAVSFVAAARAADLPLRDMLTLVREAAAALPPAPAASHVTE